MMRKSDRFLHDFIGHRQKNIVLTILLFAYGLDFLALVWNSNDAYRLRLWVWRILCLVW